MDNLPLNIENMSKKDVSLMNPIVLAFIGDAVYTLYVRVNLVHSTDAKAHALHVACSDIVKASAQAIKMDAIIDRLTEDEIAIYKRARNAHVHTSAKNATLADYMKATGFEAIIGYLYLIGEHDRLHELLGEDK